MLGVCGRPADPARPVVCLDETSRQPLGEARPPRPPAAGRPARPDPEYVRGGVADLFLAAEPLRGWREVLASDRRTRLDFAHAARHLAGVRDPDAERIVLVLDQLSTHSPASLSAASPPAEARRLADRLELHHTPEHGGWLNTAEVELAVLQRRCLRPRFGDRGVLEAAVAAWAGRRNAAGAAVDRRFTAAGARTTLERLYPAFDA